MTGLRPVGLGPVAVTAEGRLVSVVAVASPMEGSLKPVATGLPLTTDGFVAGDFAGLAVVVGGLEAVGGVFLACACSSCFRNALSSLPG